LGYYEQPSERSDLAKLTTTLMRLQKEYGSVDEALQALKAYGKLHLRCNGFAEMDAVRSCPSSRLSPTGCQGFGTLMGEIIYCS